MTDWGLLRGMVCSCPPHCTTGTKWGDGDRDCNPDCGPCRLMAGTPYSSPAGHRAERHDVTCEICCDRFVASMPNATYCSARCRQRAHRGWAPGRCHDAMPPTAPLGPVAVGRAGPVTPPREARGGGGTEV